MNEKKHWGIGNGRGQPDLDIISADAVVFGFTITIAACAIMAWAFGLLP